MAEIRPLERDDLAEVASLYEHVARSGAWSAPPGLAEHFERTFIDYPWADPEIPSLVYVDGGKIGGFLGSNVRPMVFDGRPARLAISGHLVTDPDVRAKAAGAFLMREHLSGPQDLTITDTASDTSQRIWEGLGGQTFYLGCVGWVRVFEPFHSGWDFFARRRRPGLLGTVVRPVLALLDAVSVRLGRRALRVGPTRTETVELTAASVAEHVEAVAGAYRLRPAYEDERGVAWLLDELARVKSRGTPVARLVRTTDGRVRGWFVYYLRPGGIAQVLQVAGSDYDVGHVLDALLADASARGASAVQGRVEGHVFERLAQRRCLLHASGYLPLIHGRDPELLYAVQSGQALLTRLEGEWWTGHHLEPFLDTAS